MGPSLRGLPLHLAVLVPADSRHMYLSALETGIMHILTEGLVKVQDLSFRIARNLEPSLKCHLHQRVQPEGVRPWVDDVHSHS